MVLLRNFICNIEWKLYFNHKFSCYIANSWRGCVSNDNNLRKGHFFIFPKLNIHISFIIMNLKKPVLDVKMWIGICKLWYAWKTARKTSSWKNHCLKSRKNGRKHVRGWGGGRQKSPVAFVTGVTKPRCPHQAGLTTVVLLFPVNRSHLKQNGHRYLGVVTTWPQSRSPRSCFAECFFFFFSWEVTGVQ